MIKKNLKIFMLLALLNSSLKASDDADIKGDRFVRLFNLATDIALPAGSYLIADQFTKGMKNPKDAQFINGLAALVPALYSYSKNDGTNEDLGVAAQPKSFWENAKSKIFGKMLNQKFLGNQNKLLKIMIKIYNVIHW